MTERGYTLSELAPLVQAELVGDGSATITGVASLPTAAPDQIGFYANSKYHDQLLATRAGAVLIRAEHAQDCPVPALIVKDPYYAYARVASTLHPRERAAPGVHPSAVVADDAVLEADVAIGPNAVVESGARIGRGTEIGPCTVIGRGARLGENCVLAGGVQIASDCIVGDNAIFHSGVVIGADGFGFAPGPEGWRKVPQLGIVRIGNDVEIGANSTVDRGTLGDTVIGDGCKLDNQVHIGHNCRVGAHTVFAGCSALAGSVTLGSWCMIGGQSAITGHIEITDGVTITGMTGVTNSIHEKGIYASPLPAQPVRKWRKNAVRFTQLDAMSRRIQALERELAELRDQIKQDD